MANSPVDRNTEIMNKEHGTRVLITDQAADKYLEEAARAKRWRHDLRWRSDLDAAN